MTMGNDYYTSSECRALLMHFVRPDSLDPRHNNTKSGNVSIPTARSAGDRDMETAAMCPPAHS